MGRDHCASDGQKGARIGFNPRVRMGRDMRTPKTALAARVFQSTRPHGTRRMNCPGSNDLRLFQSTRPHGTRPDSLIDLDEQQEFQSTRPHGTRP